MTDSQEHITDLAKVRIPPVLFFLPMLIAVAFHYLVLPIKFSLPEELGGWITRVAVGTIISLIGFGMQGLAVVEFRKTNQTPNVEKPTTSIIQSGPYRISRNPMYLGAVLIHLGVGIGTGSIWVLATVIVAIAMTHFLAIVPEEDYLERKFGNEYRMYKTSTRRWL